jgi:hypothetical protein
MKSLYQHLDKSQLVTILEIICGETGLLIDTDRDPDSNQHRVYAAHPTGGTFTVLSLPKPITGTYRVSCFSHSVSELVFHVTAESAEQAIDFASQRTDGIRDILPIAEHFMETTDEKGWRADLIR